MDEEGHINFKALRAKFQEEALLAQSKTGRPAVSEKPKYIPPPGGHCTPVVSSINTAAENKTSGLTRVIFRDALRTSGGKRPISFPPQPQRISPSPQLTDGGGTARHSRYMPLVLPVLPAKDQKAESTAKKEHKVEPEPGKDVLPQPKIKKKGLLLPFKSVKPSKVSAESGEELPYDYLATRLCSPPGELPSVEKQTTEDGVSLQSDQSTTEWPLSSPDVSVTPPSAETCADSDSKIISTLEKAKKKFSRRSILTSSKPKSLHSPDGTCRHKVLPSPPKNTDSTGAELPIPPPVCLPPLACISARPFFKASSSLRKSPFQKELGREKSENLPVKTAGPHPPCVPQKKLPPDLRTLGPLPAKPPRPPIVNLSRYYAPLLEVSLSLSKAPVEEPESEHPPVSNPVLDAPEFPDFENTESETPGGGGVDIAALELEALDLVSTNPPAAAGAERPQPDLSARDPAGAVESSIIQDLNLGSENIIPLDPASFPEPINLSEFPEPAVPEQKSQSEEVLVESFSKSPSDETDVGVAECQSFPEETELSNHSSVHQQDSYYETYTNVYEDVESINKFTLGQNLNKRKGSLKNPYAENQRKKEEPYLNKRQRNPWVGVSAEYLAPNHIHSPNTTDHKERKKREKQRLEKEKKEQKEREKKENEMKKKFKVTGDEEPMYHAKVMVASKVRKNDLPVKSGDTVSIIRTTNCPKGKWLARDANSKYGYISVMNVELNIKEMLELGKKAQAAGKGSNTEGDNISIGSRSSNHPVLTSSFTDDSEEWAYEDETLSPFSESHSFPQQTASVSETSYTHVVAQNTPNDASPQDVHSQNRHEALHKLAVFFQHAKDELGDVPDDGVATFTNDEPQNLLSTVEELPYPEQEVDFTELELLPPPPIFADT